MAATLTARNSRLAFAGALAVLLATTGCTTDPVTGQQRMSRTGTGAAIGAGAGALLGLLIGGNTTGALIGAGVGSIAGGGVGSYMDRQERDLRQATAGTDIEVQRQGDEIQLVFPDTITFDFNSAVVKPAMRTQLQEVSRVLNNYPSSILGVYGHTDNVGSAEVNQRLSEQRAESVAGSLESFGVNRVRMQVRGYGYTQPIASNSTPEGRAQNRRVELRVVPVSQEQMQGYRQ